MATVCPPWDLSTSRLRTSDVRLYALAALLLAVPGATVATNGTSLRVPAGWHAAVSKTPGCDPIRLIVASSAPLRITANGTVPRPSRGDVTVLLLEDRLKIDQPHNAPPRPAHFVVRWNELREITSICGNPKPPAYMFWFRTNARYLGFIVDPAGTISQATRARTLALMDSLRVK
jgi:hypothetical protein